MDGTGKNALVGPWNDAYIIQTFYESHVSLHCTIDSWMLWKIAALECPQVLQFPASQPFAIIS
jgi:hypothetical protein